MLSTHPHAVYVLGLVCALVLLFSGASKILVGRKWFAETLYEQRVMPPRIQHFVAAGLPLLELITGFSSFFLLGTQLGRLTFVGVATLFGILGIYLIRILTTGRSVACGCLSGDANEPTTKYHLFRTLLLTLAAIVVAANDSSSPPFLVQLILLIGGAAAVSLLTILPSFIAADRRIAGQLEGSQAG